MRSYQVGLIFGFSALLTACESGQNSVPEVVGADLVIMNAKVVTMAGKSPGSVPTASAICIAGGEISSVGSDADAELCMGAKTRVVDAGGRLVLPGLMDSHMHAFMGSIEDSTINFSLADTPEKFMAALQQLKEELPGDDLVRARGWQNHLFDPKGMRASVLDEVFGDRPVILSSVDGHSQAYSSRTLEMAGITADTPDPEPGVSYFERDENGVPLGTAREGLAFAMVAKAFPAREQSDFRAAFVRWLPRAAESGLTAAFDAGMSAPTTEDGYQILSELAAEDALTMRFFTSDYYRGDAAEVAAQLKGYGEKYGSDLVKPVAVKFFADGVPEGHTAYLTGEYLDMPGYSGKPNIEPEKLNDAVAILAENGIASHIHAIGGAAVKMALDAQAAAPLPAGGPRHGIAHMDLADREDIPRFAEHDIVAQTSIQWATYDPSFYNIGAFVGEDVLGGAYAVRSVIESGGVQSFGTDWPAAPYLSSFKPFNMIEVAVTRRLPGKTEGERRLPEEALTVMQAVWAMTRATAHQVGESDLLGSLEAGKAADLIILDQDIFEIEPFDIHKTTSLMTIVGGRIVRDKLSDQ